MILKPVLCQRHIEYECGCKGQFPVLGNFSKRYDEKEDKFVEMREWHVIPYALHYNKIAELEKRLETDWLLLHNGKR